MAGLITTEHKVTYSLGNSGCNCKGYCFNPEFIKKIFPAVIKDKLVDAEGTKEMMDMLGSLPQTGFNNQNMMEILTITLDDINVTPWKIGEAFAEYFLETSHGVRFWYNHMRDLRNLKANPAGVDLIGFSTHEGETLFVFGEVKTSNDLNVPPHILYGRDGLKAQISEVYLNPKNRHFLVRYMIFKVTERNISDPFSNDFWSALKTYRKSNKRVHVIGILVRDTESNPKDLEARYTEYLKNCSKELIIQFIGLYIPIRLNEWINLVKGISN